MRIKTKMKLNAFGFAAVAALMISTSYGAEMRHHNNPTEIYEGSVHCVMLDAGVSCKDGGK
jgi:hypothetical protein